MKPKFRIHVSDRGYFDIMPNGDIVRLDIEGFKPSGQWKLVALVDRYNRRVINFDDMNAESIAALGDLNFKNGKGKFRVMDFDHGSHRIWGTTGKLSIWFN